MAGERDHVFFRNPKEGVFTLRQRTRNSGNQNEKEEEDEPIDYRLKQQSFAVSQANFGFNHMLQISFLKQAERSNLQIEIFFIPIKS